MKRPIFMSLVMALLLGWVASGGLWAQEWVALPKEKNLLANAPSLPWSAAGENASQVSFVWNGARMRVTVAGPRVLKTWAICVEAPLSSAVDKGDVLYLRFRARCLDTKDESGSGRLDPVVQLTTPPFTQEIAFPMAVGREWQTFATRVKASRDYPAGSLAINLRLGSYAPQVLELEDIELYRLRPSDGIALPPVTPPPSYAGREAGAAWRKQAEARIDRLRKQDLKIMVTDSAGHPVPGATVHVEQLRHAYHFGTAVQLWAVTGTSEDDARYRTVLKDSFDSCGTENDLKWNNWLSDKPMTMRGLSWLHDAGFPVRGHVLLWPGWNHVPAFLSSLKADPEKLRAAIFDHVKDELTATAPFVGEFDVINEPLLNHEVSDVCGGNAFLADIYREARRAAPGVRLYMNEAVTLSDNRLMRGFLKIVDDMIARNAPIDGLGIQCHYTGWTLTPPEQILSTLDLLATRKKRIMVTEFDLDTTDEQLQADYLRDFYTAVFSNPATVGIQMWGFWEGRDWRPSAALWRKDWSLRPAGRVYLDLVRGKWWTKAGGTTDADGSWALRAFKGTHRITVQHGTQSVVREIGLGDRPETVTLRLGSGDGAGS